MALRRVAVTASRRLLFPSEAFGSAYYRAGANVVGFTSSGRGGTGSSQVQLARFWTWGFSKDGDQGKKDDDGVDGEAPVGAGEDPKEPDGTKSSPWTNAMQDSIGEGGASSGPPRDRERTAGPKWNVPFDEPSEEFRLEQEAQVQQEHHVISSSPPPSSFREDDDAGSRKPAQQSRSRRDGPKGKTGTPHKEANNLYVRNLPTDFDAGKLAELFLPHGDVLSTKYTNSGGRTPSGLVRFSSAEEAAAAIEALNGKKIGESGEASLEQGLDISVARKREDIVAERAKKQAKMAEKQAKMSAKMAENRKNLRSDIHIRYCPTGLSADQLSKVFAPFGEVSSIKLFNPNGENPSAVFKLPILDARVAVASLQGVQLEGCKAPMEVSFAVRRGQADKNKSSVPKVLAKPNAEKVALAQAAAKLVAVELAEETRQRQQSVNAKISEIQDRVRAYVPRSKRGRADDFTDRRKGGERGAAAHSAGRRGRRPDAGPGVGSGGRFRGGAGDRSDAHVGMASLSDDVREKLAAAAEKMRTRHQHLDKFTDKQTFGGGGSRPRGGGRQSGQERGDAPKRMRNARHERTQAMIDESVREARNLLSNEEPWEWDPGVFQTHMAVELGDNLNDAEIYSAPYLPGLSKPREHDDGETLLMKNKDMIMRFSGIEDDSQFEEIKKEALASFEQYKKMLARARVKRGESPIQGDFMAERQLLADEVSAIGVDNALHQFAQKAVTSLDGNSGWSYDKKIQALKYLTKAADKFQRDEEQGQTL